MVYRLLQISNKYEFILIVYDNATNTFIELSQLACCFIVKPSTELSVALLWFVLTYLIIHLAELELW